MTGHTIEVREVFPDRVRLRVNKTAHGWTDGILNATADWANGVVTPDEVALSAEI